jgi:hypothetical protein
MYSRKATRNHIAATPVLGYLGSRA